MGSPRIRTHSAKLGWLASRTRRWTLRMGGPLGWQSVPHELQPQLRLYHNVERNEPSARLSLQGPQAEFRMEVPFRHQRIDEVLSKHDQVSIEDSLQLQTDVISIPARTLAFLCQSLSSNDVKTKSALQLLKGWNGDMDAELSAAALYET